FAALEGSAACGRLGSSCQGLATEEARRRLEVHGPNSLAEQEERAAAAVLLRALLNPLVLLLAILGGSSLATGDAASAAIMAVMLALGVGLRFVQEWRAAAAVAGLRTLIGVRATAVRDGQPVETPLVELVPGDVVMLSAGDMIPADVRLLAAKDLFLAQATFTGESFPVEKHAARDDAAVSSPLELTNLCWLGTSVASGTATALVVATGRRTLLGGMSRSLEEPEPPTAFDLGMERFTWLMVGIVAVMVPLVFLINGVMKGNWGDAFLFALAVGVGITPEMLPMIVTVCLSRGALLLARERVIVKHLDAIQNLGGMDVLCTDKTGTLTLDRIILERHCDVFLRDDPEVLRLAWLNSHFQTGLKNLLDRAILDHEELREHVAKEGWEKVDEIPFDFSRRVMSVVVAAPGGRRLLVCKGAPEAVYARCSRFAVDGRTEPFGQAVPERLRRE
ncbi:magnesium-translocating P-type ATPase, partial [bacterium]|nr:magnesium-translocating P-type ATPase [bacterium]